MASSDSADSDVGFESVSDGASSGSDSDDGMHATANERGGSNKQQLHHHHHLRLTEDN